MNTIARMTFPILFGCLLFSNISHAADEDTVPLIKIISPQEGDIVNSTFEVTYQLQVGLKAHYVHIFLDGNYQKDTTSFLKNVPGGPHELSIKISTDEQDSLVGWDSINVTVQ